MFSFTGLAYDAYDVDSNLESLEPYSVVVRKKRQTTTSVTDSSPQKSPELPKSNESQSATPSPNNTDSSTNSIQFNSTIATATTTKPTLLVDQRLLGVNGTGQRKVPFTVSDPISSDPSTSTTPKPIILDTTTDGAYIGDIVDVPDNETEILAKEHNITEFKEVRHSFSFP